MSLATYLAGNRFKWQWRGSCVYKTSAVFAFLLEMERLDRLRADERKVMYDGDGVNDRQRKKVAWHLGNAR